MRKKKKTVKLVTNGNRVKFSYYVKPPTQPRMSGHRWQVKLSGQWKNYGDQEHACLCRAYMSGSKQARYTIRGETYTYDFTQMQQINDDSGKTRKIRPPPNMKPPAAPLLPPGPTMCVTVPQGARGGDTLMVPHPMNKAIAVQVAVPMNAYPGATLLVPVPVLQQQQMVMQPMVPAQQVPVQPTVPMQPVPQQQQISVTVETNGGNNNNKDQKPAGYTETTTTSNDALKYGAGGVAAGIGMAGAAGAVGFGVAAANGDLGNVGDAVVGAAGAAGDGITHAAVTVGDAMDPVLAELNDMAGDAGDFIMNLF